MATSIRNGDATQARVALFKRSGTVRTYQHKWAPLSGSVEEHDATLLQAALREIHEETKLLPNSLDLLRVGKPYSLIDESVGREWIINPFAFRLKDASEGGQGEEGIELDAEHERFHWFDPMQVNGSDEFGGVPRLVHSLRRVWPEYDLGSNAGRTLTEGIRKIQNDREHGARQLAGVAISTLRDVICQILHSQTMDESVWVKVRMAAWHICQSRPSMAAAITTTMVKALTTIRVACQLTDIPTADRISHINRELDGQLSQKNYTVDRICQSFIDYVHSNVLKHRELTEPVSILTLSSSSTITSCLIHAASTIGLKFDLRVLESRPLFEGVTTAVTLSQNFKDSEDLKITVYSDASAALAARGVNLVLLGADRISSAGDVSNKIGSLPAVLSARYITPNVKVLVLSDTEKIGGLGSMEEHDSEENSPLELRRAWGTVKGAERVNRVENAYFEWVPASLIDTYITEEGHLSTEQIQQKSEWIHSQSELYFNDL
ncbi:hypothetical protein GQX73_g9083 [Xylaria multiplex]|uniref:Nudix hydrolase domain-containing protein n=1 Tax=Xylaria multiplex TaxID=323545 RepID=A0A7C8IMX9_9PEZI|nr:hypothetical protein GQX73_g9083 [Xylaria multiplex]